MITQKQQKFLDELFPLKEQVITIAGGEIFHENFKKLYPQIYNIMPTTKQSTELKQIGNFIYGFQNYSQAKLYQGKGLEKSKGKDNVVIVLETDGECGTSWYPKNAVECKELVARSEQHFIAVKKKEIKPFKHPKQFAIIERPKAGVEYHVVIDGIVTGNR